MLKFANCFASAKKQIKLDASDLAVSFVVGKEI